MGERAAASARSRLSAEAMAGAYRRLYDTCGTRIGRGSAVNSTKGVGARPRVGTPR